MKTFITKTWIILCSVFAGSLTTQVNAQSLMQIDRLVRDLEFQSHDLVNELAVFRMNRNYDRLVLAALEMRQFAQKMHDVIHVTGNLTHMEVALAQLEGRYFHFKGMFAAIEHGRPCPTELFAIQRVKDRLCGLKSTIDAARVELRFLRRHQFCPSLHRHTITRGHPTVGFNDRHFHSGVYQVSPFDTNQFHLRNDNRFDNQLPQNRLRQQRFPGDHFGHGPLPNSQAPGWVPNARDAGQRGGISFSLGGGSSRISFQF
ncbi:MAG TPA: hypothetical protein PKD64_06355 [Pirellulaceae bacterium]|nr:hypothetical protein [Pirellulaceae bacterium]HMO91803.1 hypothetical protein [Pirellulaceae bacterium]HMP69866.1 hypothetical protein [Pirellulaceae bacterium]